MAAKKIQVRTAHPGDVLQVSTELRITDQGVFVKDKLQDSVSETQANELQQVAEANEVPLVVTDLSQADQPGEVSEGKA